MEAKVISSFGRRDLELMKKVDQLMPMLETSGPAYCTSRRADRG
jgi:hypothetical protein